MPKALPITQPTLSAVTTIVVFAGNRLFANTLKLIGYRLLATIPILLGVVVVTFVLVRVLPGDPVIFFSNSPGMTIEDIAEIRHQLGLDRPLIEQLQIFLSGLLRGDLGNSLMTGQAVIDDLRQRLPASIELSIIAFVIALIIAIPLGLLSAINANTTIDHIARLLSALGTAMPTFVLGLILIFVFFYKLGWAPEPIGRINIFLGEPAHITGFFLIDSLLERDIEKFKSAAAQLCLPAATMAIFVLAPLIRVTRASMLTVLNSDFIRTARAAGLSNFDIYVVYAFRNAMIPVLTTMGLVFSYMLGANILVEKVFAWPGVGSYALDAMNVSDYAPVQGFILLMGGVYVLLNLVIDILYGIVDPRIQIK